jgi:hypothetical protein
MDQVRTLAQDCNNCIDLYLYRGNPDIHLGKGFFERYLRWVPWFVKKKVAQHRAALELGKLKDRARDVGERRTRYGVEVPRRRLRLGRRRRRPQKAAGKLSSRSTGSSKWGLTVLMME